jgi:hypothetical protein
MIAPLYPTLSCCGARATASNIVGHKCSGRGPVAVHGEGRKTPSDARIINSADPAPSRPGKAAEDALAAALVQAGYEVVTYAAWMRRAFDGHYTGWVTQFPVGIMLAPARRYRADLFHPSSRTVAEVEGGAHGIQKQRRGDILREQLLTAAGLRVVRVLPEQCIDGSAVELVVNALRGKEQS